MKKLIVVALIFLFTTGRWDYHEIKDYTIITGMGVDRTEGGQWLMTFEMIKIPPSPQQPIEPVTLSSAGETPQQAIHNVTGDVSYNLYLGHAWMWIISEETARKGIGDLIRLITANPEYYLATDVAVVRESPAKDVFDSERVSTPFMAYELYNGFETDMRYIGKTNPIYAYHIYPMLDNPYEGYLIPALGVWDKNEKQVTGNYGSAIFQQDRLVGFLTPEETQVYRIATGKIRSADLHIPVDGAQVSLQVQRCKTGMRVTWRGDMPEFTLTVELRLSTAMLFAHAELEALGKAAQQRVEEEVRALVATSQAMRCDFIGFANLLRRYHLLRWNQIKGDWQSIIADMPCAVEVRVEVVN